MQQPEGAPSTDPVEHELRRVGAEVRQELLRAGAGLVGPEQERAARASMLRIMQARPRNSARRRIVILALALSAAALALLFFTRGDETEEEPLLLGPGPIRLLAPRRAVAAFGRFAWEGEPPAGGRFELRIQDAEGERSVVVSRELEENHWSPPDESALPRKITWSITIVDALSEPLFSDSAEAWRSP